MYRTIHRGIYRGIHRQIRILRTHTERGKYTGSESRADTYRPTGRRREPCIHTYIYMMAGHTYIQTIIHTEIRHVTYREIHTYRQTDRDRPTGGHQYLHTYRQTY